MLTSVFRVSGDGLTCTREYFVRLYANPRTGGIAQLL
jgi:hypothetical protein